MEKFHARGVAECCSVQLFRKNMGRKHLGEINDINAVEAENRKEVFGCSNVFGTCFRYCSVSKSNRFFMSNLWEERLKISQKLPPSPLPSELLRAASYARRRCASERGGSIVLLKIVGTSNPTFFLGGVLFGIISLCWLHPVDVVSYYYLNFFLVSVDIFPRQEETGSVKCKLQRMEVYQPHFVGFV